MIDSFKKICLFRQKYPAAIGNGIKTSNPLIRPVVIELQKIQNWLENRYQGYRGINFKFKHSAGEGNFPGVLHVSILPPDQEVSKGIYVAICFDKNGAGALIGCIESMTNPQGLNTVVRTNHGPLNIDVNGFRATTKYNDAFENPKEFFVNKITLEEIELHITESLELCLYHLKYIDKPNLQIGCIVNAKEVDDFNPNSIWNAKDKIATFISQRRGQKGFRNKLLKAYGYKCSITECDVLETLEAAHIIPYNGELTNHIQNGIILRADIHVLFDIGLITIDPERYIVVLSDKLKNTFYNQYNNKKIILPKNKSSYPSQEALSYHYNNLRL